MSRPAKRTELLWRSHYFFFIIWLFIVMYLFITKNEKDTIKQFFTSCWGFPKDWETKFDNLSAVVKCYPKTLRVGSTTFLFDNQRPQQKIKSWEAPNRLRVVSKFDPKEESGRNTSAARNSEVVCPPSLGRVYLTRSFVTSPLAVKAPKGVAYTTSHYIPSRKSGEQPKSSSTSTW